MEYVNQEILAATVRFVFDETPPETRLWILKRLKKIVPGEAVKAVFRLEDGKWYVTLDSQDSVMKVTSAAWPNLTPKVHVERCDRRTVKMKVNWLPVWIDVKVVPQHLSKYGEVLECQRETETEEGITFVNGSLKVTYRGF